MDTYEIVVETHGNRGQIVIQPDNEAEQFLVAEYFLLCPSSALSMEGKLRLAELREMTAPHKRGYLAEFEQNEKTLELDKARLNTIAELVCENLNGSSREKREGTPLYSFRREDITYYKLMDTRLKGKEGMPADGLSSPAVRFTINLRTNLERSRPFLEMTVDKPNENTFAPAIKAACFEMTKWDPKLRENVSGSPRNDPNDYTPRLG